MLVARKLAYVYGLSTGKSLNHVMHCGLQR